AKWSGICAGLGGWLFCAPHDACAVLAVSDGNRELKLFGDLGSNNSNNNSNSNNNDDVNNNNTSGKWFGIAAGNCGRLLYCAPYNAQQVLVIDSSTLELSFVEGAGEGTRKWSGIARGPDGLLFCAPYDADEVLVIDPRSDSLALIPCVGGAGKAKWSGIALAADGQLYCAPACAKTVL
ncbi:unnamed protein product, partial [Polarella glacialis]